MVLSNQTYELLYGLLQKHGYTSYRHFVEALVADWLAEANRQRLADYQDTEVWIDAVLDQVPDPIIHSREKQRFWRKKEPKPVVYKLEKRRI